jgi:hypothetical protein
MATVVVVAVVAATAVVVEIAVPAIAGKMPD